MDSSNQELFYRRGSAYIEEVIARCSTLQTGYQPPTLWGKNAHVQTTLFGTVGRPSVPELPQQQRFSVVAIDGSTLLYDVFEPEGTEEGCGLRSEGEEMLYTVFVCPGINNSSENSYVRGFAAYCMEVGFRVIVFNHLGALKSETLTAHRIFTYGGTGDIALVFDDACRRYPGTKFMGIGFSLGACILVRFLGEKKERRKQFVCAASLCQGYDPLMHLEYVYDWKKMRRLYSFQLSKFHRKLIMRHKHKLFPSSEYAASSSGTSSLSFPQASEQGPSEQEASAGTASSSEGPEEGQELPKELYNGFPTEITHDGHNCNGCSLDRSKCTAPDMRALLSSTTLSELDEAYTRRVLGFSSVQEMYRWVSCEKLLYQIDDIPVLLVNSADDPCIIEESHCIPKKFVENQPNSLFVLTHYGGHLGFYEGGVIPNRLSWLDRLFVEFANACLKANQDL